MEIAHAIRPRNLLVENVPGWLNMPDNAFGCFLGALVGADDALCSPLDGKWPSAGMVAGPRARAAWRVFDAPYFGVAQRDRKSVGWGQSGSVRLGVGGRCFLKKTISDKTAK